MVSAPSPSDWEYAECKQKRFNEQELQYLGLNNFRIFNLQLSLQLSNSLLSIGDLLLSLGGLVMRSLGDLGQRIMHICIVGLGCLVLGLGFELVSLELLADQEQLLLGSGKLGSSTA